MQKQSFDQLAAEAAAGLRADHELFLDVKQELCSHLEEKAQYFTRQGHNAEESAVLAQRSFGSPLDVAAELLDANKRKMRLRSLARLFFGALVLPLAILLALYVGYGRFARVQAMTAKLYDAYEPNGAPKLPTLPFFGIPDTYYPPSPVINQLRGTSENAGSILSYWVAHRHEPNSHIFYAYYALFLQQNDERSYVAAMRQGELLEPQNALYNEFLAVYYLSRGMLAKAEKLSKADEIITDEVRDRRSFELGILELQKAAQKPYLHGYEGEVLHTRLNALPRPLLTEDYLQHIAIASGVLFPHLARHRTLARKIPGCARILLAEGRINEAEAVMDTWKPLVTLFSRDGDSMLIKGLTALACGTQLAKDGHDVYGMIGNQAKAQDAGTRYEQLIRVKSDRNNSAPGQTAARERLLQQHGSRQASVLYPVFGGVEPGDLSPEDLTPGRMHEHVLVEGFTTQFLLIILALMLIGALLQGSIWLYRLRRSASIPLLLMPPAHVILRALLLGIIAPMLIYWLYARLPLIGGREYGWASTMWPRFAVELLLVSFLMICLPAHRIRRYIRCRCEDLGIAISEKREERSINRRVFGGVIAACIVAAVSLFLPGDISPLLRLAGVVLSAGVCFASLHFANRKREQYGLYYGTLARSLAPIYAFSILAISLIAQPWLLYNEANWLRKDTMVYGYVAHSSKGQVSITKSEAIASKRLTQRVLKVLE